MGGFFITFEGNEASGKSTQIQLLADKIKSTGRSVLVLREPGGTAIGEEIRHLLKHHPANGAMTPETELLLMNASRAQLVREIIQPALHEGKVVLCDRFYDSTIVYQGYGRQLPLEEVERIIQFAVNGLHPDLTLLLHVPLSLSESRRADRSRGHRRHERDRMEEAGQVFFKRVEEAFERIATMEPDRIHRIEAAKPIEMVANEIWDIVAARLPLF